MLVIILAVAAVIVIACIVMFPTEWHARDTGARTRCSSQVRQLALAMQMYDAQHGSLPPAYVEREGHKHSWRILILPYLERNDLYLRYRFDEPWDGPNNRLLASEIRGLYRCLADVPGTPADVYTNYFVITGPGTIFEDDKAMTTSDIVAGDGLTNTVLIVEAANTGIHWMEPRDLSIDDIGHAFDASAGKFLSSYHDGGANVAFADTRTTFLHETIDPKVLQAIITPKGGETIDEADLP